MRATNLKAVLEGSLEQLAEVYAMVNRTAPRSDAERAQELLLDRITALRQELEQLDSCLLKAAPGEPLFVLRAQDTHAPHLVRTWGDMVLGSLRGRNDPQAERSRDKVREADEVVHAMTQWQAQNPDRVKVPD